MPSYKLQSPQAMSESALMTFSEMLVDYLTDNPVPRHMRAWLGWCNGTYEEGVHTSHSLPSAVFLIFLIREPHCCWKTLSTHATSRTSGTISDQETT